MLFVITQDYKALITMLTLNNNNALLYTHCRNMNLQCCPMPTWSICHMLQASISPSSAQTSNIESVWRHWRKSFSRTCPVVMASQLSNTSPLRTTANKTGEEKIICAWCLQWRTGGHYVGHVGWRLPFLIETLDCLFRVSRTFRFFPFFSRWDNWNRV